MALVSIARDVYVGASSSVASAPVSLAGANGVHLAVTAISIAAASSSTDFVSVIPQISVDGVSWRGFGAGAADASIMDFTTTPGTSSPTQYGLGTAQETVAPNAPTPRLGSAATAFKVALGAVYFRVVLKSSNANSSGVFSVDVNTFVA